MKTPLLIRVSAIALAVLLTSVAIGQDYVRPRQTPEERLAAETVSRASRMSMKARELFRAGRIPEAEGLAQGALQVVAPFRISDSEALDILAEAALLRKDLAGALRHLTVSNVDPNDRNGLSWRGCMTRVLVLLTLRRNAEAESFLMAQIGTHDEPSDWRYFPGGFDLPVDHDRSPAGIAATAHVLRGSHEAISGDPEILEDLRQAEKLAPASPLVRLLIADQLMLKKRFEEARPYYQRLAAANENRSRRAGEFGLERVKLAIAGRDQGKSGG